MKSITTLLLFFASLNLYSDDSFWEVLNNIKYYNVSQIEINRKGTIFALTHNGIFRSYDDGKTYESVTRHSNLDVLFRGQKNKLKIDGNDRIFFNSLNSSNCLYISTDDGSSWIQQSPFPKSSMNEDIYETLIDYDIDSNNNIYVATDITDYNDFRFYFGIYKSEDLGQSWISLLDTVYDDSLVRELYSFDENHIICNCGLDKIFNCILKTDDGGNTWEKTDNGNMSTYFNSKYKWDFNICSIDGILGYSTDQFKTVNPIFRPDRYFIIGDIHFKDEYSFIVNTSDGIAKTNDKGQSWDIFNNGFNNYYGEKFSLLGFSISSNGNYFRSHSSWGIFKSTDEGKNWTFMESNINSFYFYDMEICLNGDIYTHSPDIMKSTDMGETWEYFDFLDKRFTSLVETKTGSILASEYYGEGIYRSTNGGDSWEICSNGLIFDHQSEGFEPFIKMKVDSKGNILGLLYGGGVQLSTDDGKSWDKLSCAFPTTPHCIGINSLDWLFIGGMEETIVLSKDGGNSWQKVHGFQGMEVSAITFNSIGEGYATIRGANNLYTSNHGQSWNEIGFTSDFGEFNAKVQSYLGFDDKFLFTTWHEGKYLLFERMNSNHELKLLDSVESYGSYGEYRVFPHPSGHYVGSLGFEGFVRSKKVYVGVDNQDDKDERNEIISISPNPAEDVVYITAFIPASTDESSVLNIEIVNQLGSVIFETKAHPGEELRVALDDIPNGLYYVRSSVNSGTQGVMPGVKTLIIER